MQTFPNIIKSGYVKNMKLDVNTSRTLNINVPKCHGGIRLLATVPIDCRTSVNNKQYGLVRYISILLDHMRSFLLNISIRI